MQCVLVTAQSLNTRDIRFHRTVIKHHLPLQNQFSEKMSTSYQNDIESIDSSLKEQIEQEHYEGFTIRGKLAIGALAGASVLFMGAFINASSSINSTEITKNVMAMQQAHFSNYGHSTRSNENSKELIYLDRHDLDCGRDPISRFKMNPDVSYHYSCMSLANTMPIISDTQRSYESGFHEDHHLIYYDRQSVYCPSDKLMTRLHGKNHHGNFGYSFTCAKYDWSHLSCSTHHTNYNEATDKSIVFLDRHDVQCPHSEALQSFRGQSSGGQLRYEYTCCAVHQHSPTAAPVANPTHSPTDKPVAEPTKNPTFAPTINEKALVCPITIDSSNKYFRKKLPSGCAMIALNDIEVDPESKAIIACGAMKLSKADLEDYGVKKGIDENTGLMKKGRSVSYLHVGKNVKIDYFVTDDHTGAHDTFEYGDEPIRGHIVNGVDTNDHIKSLKIEVKSFDGLEIPARCSEMEIFN